MIRKQNWICLMCVAAGVVNKHVLFVGGKYLWRFSAGRFSQWQLKLRTGGVFQHIVFELSRSVSFDFIWPKLFNSTDTKTCHASYQRLSAEGEPDEHANDHVSSFFFLSDLYYSLLPVALPTVMRCFHCTGCPTLFYISRSCSSRLLGDLVPPSLFFLINLHTW